MGFGGMVLAIVGAFIRWMITGFKGSFRNLYTGREEDDVYKGASQDIFNKIIGLLTIISVILLIGFLIQYETL